MIEAVPSADAPLRVIHLLCDDCGLITECPPHLVEAWLRELREATGFTPQPDRIDLHGHCAACPATPESS